MRIITTLLLTLVAVGCHSKKPAETIDVKANESTATEVKMSETKRVHLDIPLSTPLEVDLVSDHFAFEKFAKRPELKALAPECSPNPFTNVFGKTCKVYIGEFRTGTLPTSPLDSRFVTFEVLDREIITHDAAKDYLKKQKGWHETFDVSVAKNAAGLEIATGKFAYDGGRSYHYALVLGPNPVFISEANWVDLDSIKIKKLKK
jgi:hypothetical protein